MSDDRFHVWVRRAKSCYRAAASCDNARAALQAAQLDVCSELGSTPGTGALEEVRRALIEAEGAIFSAREKLHLALKEKTLTPDNRAVEFWKMGAP